MYVKKIEDKLKLMSLLQELKSHQLHTTRQYINFSGSWIRSIIKHVKPSNELEKQHPPPTNITNFDRIPHMIVDSIAEIGILILIDIIMLK